MKPYYEHAGITIYHGDCRDWLAGIPSCFSGFDMCLTSPPYGAMRKYGGLEPEEWLDVVELLYPAMAPGSVCVWLEALILTHRPVRRRS